MEDKIRQGYLYDFYGELLTEHQRNIFEQYVLEDLSVSEIASIEGVSRQGIHDLVKRCNKALEDYESKLHLVEKFLHIRASIEDIETITKNANSENLADSMKRIEQISTDILEEL